MNKPSPGISLTNGYRDRSAAGQVLARRISRDYSQEDPIVLALPRGGISVAREVAETLKAPLHVFVVRKIGLPNQPGVAMGALASGGVKLLDDALIAEAQLSPAVVAAQIAVETAELKRREALYRGERTTPPLEHRAVILVDDGVATGYTMRVCILALRQLNPSHLTVAIPVGAPEPCQLIEGLVDQLICPLRPEPFHAVGLAYDHFPPVTDEDIQADIEAAAQSLKRQKDSKR